MGTNICLGSILGGGELEVFSNLEDALSVALPQDSCEWRRSLGRPVKSVHIGVKFTPFSPAALPRENQWDLIRHPLFHIYWTECTVNKTQISVHTCYKYIFFRILKAIKYQ